MEDKPIVPFVVVYMILEGSEPRFDPALLQDGYNTSIPEKIDQWLDSFLDLSHLVAPFSCQVS